MATTYVSMDNLTRYDSKLKLYIDSNKTKALKAVSVKNNKINFYVDTEPSEDTVAAFSVDFPAEYFLDQAKTTFVQSFAWSEVTYPGSENPNLEGKPVFVLAVKGNDSTTFSFLDMNALIDVYTGKNTTSARITVNPDTNEISADVKISAEEGNILSVKNDGLFAEAIKDISGKADKLVNPEIGDPVTLLNQIMVDDGNGNLAGSGKTIEDVLATFEPMSDEAIDNLFAK